MSDEEKEARELRGTERLLEAIVGPEKLAKWRAEEKALQAEFHRRARDLASVDRERVVRWYLEQVVELQLRKWPSHDPDAARLETIRTMAESPEFMAGLARMLQPRIEA
jgi:hypothetical protein